MKQIKGHKHLIECRCVLPQFQDRNDVIFHQFAVFSTCTVDDELDESVEKEPTIEFHETIVACPNCNLLHRVTDFCRSTILQDDDDAVATDLDDLKVGMPNDLIGVLESYDCERVIWDEVKFAYVMDIRRDVVLRRTPVDGGVLTKILAMYPGNKYTIETKKYQLTF